MIIVRQLDDIGLVSANQLCRQNQEIRANRIERGRPVFLRQAKPLEPVNDVGGKKNQLKERDIGGP